MNIDIVVKSTGNALLVEQSQSRTSDVRRQTSELVQTRPPGLPGGRGATPAQQALRRRGAFQLVAVSEAPLHLAALGASPRKREDGRRSQTSDAISG